jgi:hypothetical protein
MARKPVNLRIVPVVAAVAAGLLPAAAAHASTCAAPGACQPVSELMSARLLDGNPAGGAGTALPPYSPGNPTPIYVLPSQSTSSTSSTSSSSSATSTSSGHGFVVPNSTNTGYVNPLIPPQNLPRPLPMNPLFPASTSPTTTTPAVSTSPTIPSTGAMPAAGVSVSIPSGWAMVSGPAGTVVTGNNGPLLTLQAGDTNYESIPNGSPLVAGESYWAYFPNSVTNTIALAPGQSTTVQLPANHSVMIGNPGSGTATVMGADYVALYNPSTGQYQQSTSIGPGQGAWAWLANGGTVTITSS